LHKAIRSFGKPVDVEWRPFQIDPRTAPLGETVDDYCERRWGGAGWTHRLKSEGQKDGAGFGDWKWWPNTSRAHQLIHYCKSRGISSTDRVNALLFRSEYETGENISLVDVLVAIGKAASAEDKDEAQAQANANANANASGFDEDDLRRYLTLNEGKAEVEAEISAGRKKYGISGVPYFVVSAGDPKNNKDRPLGFSGAQSPETFLDVFEELEGKAARSK